MIRISAPLSSRPSVTSSVHMSSQIMTPSLIWEPPFARKGIGPGTGPAANTRFSSNTP